MSTRYGPTDCGTCRATIYRKLNRISAVSILAHVEGFSELRAWRYVGQLAREIQHELLQIGSIEAEVIQKAMTPIQPGPTGRRIRPCEGDEIDFEEERQ